MVVLRRDDRVERLHDAVEGSIVSPAMVRASP